MVSKRTLFSWVFQRYRGLQVLLLVMILATIFFRVFPLEMQKQIINSAIRFKKMDALYLYCGLYVGAVILAGAFKYMINVLQGYIGQKILLEMRAQIYDHILTLPLSFFRRTQPGMVIASLTSELSVIGEFMGGAIAIPIINVLTLLTFAGYLAYLNPLLAFVSFSVYPLEILAIPFLQTRFNRLNQTRIDLTRSMSNVIGEAVSGMHEIHGNAGYELEGRKLGRFARSLFTLRHRMNIIKFLIKFANNFFQSLGPFILFLLGGYLTIEGRLDLGALVAFLSAYEKLYDPWKELMDYYQDVQDCRVRYRRVMDTFDLKPEFQLAPPEERDPIHLTGQMDVKDVTFSVDGRIHILNQVSLSLEKGEQLALVGLSGSGKSTLAMVMGQLYSYNSGHLTVDGVELKTLCKVDVSHNIGYVAQHPFIFYGSLLDNLLYACRALDRTAGKTAPHQPDLDQILAMVTAVGLSEDILRFGLNTILSHDRHSAFARELIRVRQVFFQRWGSELADVVDFFHLDRFQVHSSIAANITFGYPNRPGFESDGLSGSTLLKRFLTDHTLTPDLIQFGATVARQTVSLLKGLEEDSFFFQASPIPAEEFEQYSDMVDRMNRAGTGQFSRRDESDLLKLALRFIPAQHNMASIPPALESRILEARREFMERIGREDPKAFTFYCPTEYLYTQSILENVLFGHARVDHPLAMEDIRQKAVGLLEAENLLQEVMRAGLDFQVGSKGDRLSGGQKQKLALARALLKSPPILILDEATASLDNTSQAQVQELLNLQLKGKCTLIAVVHRLELVRNYDLIAVMRAGKIVEMGKYDELMSRKGLFYELAHGSI